jgi:hypothetical protein
MSTDVGDNESQRKFKSNVLSLLDNKILGPAIRQGLEQGRLEGRTMARREFLQDLLQERFRRTPPWAESKIAPADIETLNAWYIRALNVYALEDVFA